MLSFVLLSGICSDEQRAEAADGDPSLPLLPVPYVAMQEKVGQEGETHQDGEGGEDGCGGP